ncbi:unannotated protein [freshwater metagenome]|uniref:Unannotated protein n=1 Tax=freshwater metagenome TaxID=449393 RepID=A0A6J7VGS1_9ZZZZ|nr:MSMEG_4193 family putative phosphomutase [Actinomycetota bacterium]MSY51197.1 MSMEG_4193 family putative phosphomutase [Actinomycetota bacterium]MSY87006.1 MSMEG_4193 family putative phosphomutase [Actinomycetota bacterium]MTA50992.1 MSMEG_4193 family putative phosphomutase [Actinomycetota bacterium]
MTEILLIRHARSSANASGVLAGRAKGVHLDDQGKEQSKRLAAALTNVPITRLISSPLDRCMETARVIAIAHPKLSIEKNSDLIEMDYGSWSGQKLSVLAKRKEWKSIQGTPSLVRFPQGESFLEMNARVNQAITDIFVEHSRSKSRNVVAVFTHGDVIKAIIAHSLGLHLDAFQRIVVDPASVSILRQEGDSRFVISQNVRADGLEGLLGVRKSATTVGGGDGSSHKRVR